MRARPTPCLLLLIALPAAGCGSGGPGDAAARTRAEGDTTPLVRVSPVEMRDVQREIPTTGYLESEHAVTVLSKIAGRIVDVLVDEGDTVHKGDVLARLDDREARATVQALDVQIRERKVRVQLAALEIDAAEHRKRQSRIDRDRLQAEYDRLASQPPELVARKALEDSQFGLASAEEALRVADFLHRKSELDKLAAEVAVEELEARKLEAETRLAEHVILAPFDGTVVRRDVKGGETIGTMTELFVVVDLDHLLCYLSRPQIQLPMVQHAKQVLFTTDAYPGREFVADIDLVSPVVDEATGHFTLRARARAADAELLRPGMFIRARIMTEDVRRALMVPKTAVLADGEQSIVFAVRDHRAVKILLDPGLELQTTVECRNRGDGGLEESDVVIVAGHEDLLDQAEVEISEG